MANYIEAIRTKFVGQRDIEISDLEIFLNNPTGIGDHADIGVEIEKKLEKIDSLDSKIDTIDRYFKPQSQVQPPQQQ